VISDVEGVLVGHWTDGAAQTGCTAVLFPEGTVASGEVRGGAPGTREFELLAPERLVNAVDAVMLCGGSAFGLAACDGAMRWLEERGRGFPTSAGPVPIVVGMVLFDLMVGDASVRPDAAAGYAACDAAASSFAVGRVGAGTGATVAKTGGAATARRGGLGSASARQGDLVVGALFAVNAFGDVRDSAPSAVEFGTPSFENTTIGVVATNARLSKVECLLVAQGAHDGLARALDPVHATVDGDAVVAAATGAVDAHVDVVRALAAQVTEEAIRSAISSAG
jgi:L-aminopeptidase/D-esterase-like protein